jgi:ACT domain-containing protein
MARTIITAEDVTQMDAGATIVVDADTTITAAARELARRRGITVQDTEDGATPPAAASNAPGSAPGRASTEANAAHAAEVAAAPFVAGGALGSIIVTAVGVNRPGVMAELSTAVGGLGGDIQDVSQRITGGYFNAILVVDIQNSGKNFTAFRDALLALSEPSDYVVTVIDERVFTAMHRLG